MKHGVRPTRKQKILLSENNLNPDNWLVTLYTPYRIEFIHRITGGKRTIYGWRR